MTSAESTRRRLLNRPLATVPVRGGLSGPLYPKLLRLKHLHLSAWQRAALVEGSIAVGAVAALADQVTAWTPVVLPVAVAAVVKFHDVLTGILSPRVAEPPPTPEVSRVAYVGGQPALPALVTPPTPAAGPVPPEVPVSEAVSVPAAVSLEEPSAVPQQRRATARAVVSPARVRADLDLLTAAGLDRALNELTRRGGLDTFVLTLADAGEVSVVPLQYGPGGRSADDAVAGTLAKLANDRRSLRAVAVGRDVAIPGKAPGDAVHLDLEHAEGERERVTATYRRIGAGGQVVVGELTRLTGRRSGLVRRVFGASPDA